MHASGVEGVEAARLVARRGARAVAASPRLAVSKARERARHPKQDARMSEAYRAYEIQGQGTCWAYTVE